MWRSLEGRASCARPRGLGRRSRRETPGATIATWPNGRGPRVAVAEESKWAVAVAAVGTRSCGLPTTRLNERCRLGLKPTRMVCVNRFDREQAGRAGRAGRWTPEPMGRFELPANRLQGGCSTPELHRLGPDSPMGPSRRLPPSCRDRRYLRITLRLRFEMDKATTQAIAGRESPARVASERRSATP